MHSLHAAPLHTLVHTCSTNGVGEGDGVEVAPGDCVPDNVLVGPCEPVTDGVAACDAVPVPVRLPVLVVVGDMVALGVGEPDRVCELV